MNDVTQQTLETPEGLIPEVLPWKTFDKDKDKDKDGLLPRSEYW